VRDLPYMAVIRGLLELARDHLRYAMRASLACVALALTAVGGLIMGGLITAHPCHGFPSGNNRRPGRPLPPVSATKRGHPWARNDAQQRKPIGGRVGAPSERVSDRAKIAAGLVIL